MPTEDQLKVELDSQDDLKSKQKDKSIQTLLMEEILPPGKEGIEGMVLFPLFFGAIFTVSYLKNPLMKTHLKGLIAGSSFLWMILTLKLVDAPLWILALICLGIGLLLQLLSFLLSEFTMDVIFEIISVFAGIGWISLVSGFVLDFIAFLAFYFSFNELILSAILLSAGNTVGDLFGNSALAQKGEGVMAAIASYSG